jgi:cytochrome d ubiquinol oxidase subunit I
MCLVALLGAWLYWRGRLARTRWFLWTAVVAMVFPFAAATCGWLLTEVGRQPWIVEGLLKTSEANSPSVSSAMLAASLAVFVVLYTALAVTDFVLIRRFARLDPAPIRVAPVAEEPAAVAGH